MNYTHVKTNGKKIIKLLKTHVGDFSQYSKSYIFGFMFISVFISPGKIYILMSLQIYLTLTLTNGSHTMRNVKPMAS